MFGLFVLNEIFRDFYFRNCAARKVSYVNADTAVILSFIGKFNLIQSN